MKKIKINKKKIIFLLFFILGIYLNYKYLETKNIIIKDKEFISLITNSTFNDNKSKILEDIIVKTYKISNPVKALNNNYEKFIEEQKPNINNEPLIYIYNTHQQEEYKENNYLDFTIKPTVMIIDYILEDIFNKNNLKTIVEENNIKEVLNNNNWKYSDSYKASRIFLEDNIIKYPNLKYFIDVHRDSLKKDKTTITIDNKDYAKVLFIVGLENENYEKNLEFTEKINNKLNEYYPNLSKGILKKEGVGVNGIYNQDFNEKVILIEIGGYENTTNEVLNTTLAFSKVFMEIINEESN